MFTQKSKLKELYQTPVGKDLLDTLARYAQRPNLFQNPILANLKIKTIGRLIGKNAPGVTDAILHLINSANETPPPFPPAITKKWWKEAVVYQIYPRSFQDSDGDGIGDLNGIRRRIPYLKELGVDAVWLSPIYDSPNDDMGYDIRDYRKIMAEFGGMEDFDALIRELHANGIRLILDMVLNHTSDEHEWFQKALANPQCVERDYYIWAKGRDGDEPNNWTSFFSGPAWNRYEETDEWGLHLFSKKQMDLNWDNPGLRAEVYDMISWWREKGVDGFRLDVINLISKENLEDGNNAIGALVGFRGIEHYFYGPHLHEYLHELREKAFRDAYTVGETVGMGLEMCRMLSAEERGELCTAFNFDHMDNPGKSRANEYRYDLRFLKSHFIKWQEEYGNNCWPTLFFENHDNPRMVSKINPDPRLREVIAKLLCVLQFTLKGTPFLYQGQELGMVNASFSSVNEYRDVEAINRYHELLKGRTQEEALRITSWGTRDHARTPMQWDSSENAGFTTGEPWLKVNPNYAQINAEEETRTSGSVFQFFKNLIALRKESETLVYGSFRVSGRKEKDTFCYYRESENETFYIEINLTEHEQPRNHAAPPAFHFCMGNYGRAAESLRPYEANVYQSIRRR